MFNKKKNIENNNNGNLLINGKKLSEIDEKELDKFLENLNTKELKTFKQILDTKLMSDTQINKRLSYVS